jgi:superfamily I DNA/RNA helicase
MTVALTQRQNEAVDADFNASLAIAGGPGSGKTLALAQRIARAQAVRDDATVVVLAPVQSAIDVLRSRIASPDGLLTATTGEFAVHLLRESGAGDPLSRVRIVDDIEAELLFAQAAEPLLELTWPEFETEALDPEVPGLRSPRRFLEAAFRLIRKLRDAQISPEDFLRSAHVGATAFYAKPPNFAHPNLLLYTKETYRDSLDVTPAELARQFRHEAHLATIVSKLYRTYLDLQKDAGLLTARDAVAEATHFLGRRPDLTAALRARFFAVFVDEAQELNLGELALLQALFGDELERVTLAGDPDGATGTFRGARPERIFPAARQRIVLDERFRSPAPLASAISRLRLTESPTTTNPTSTMLRLHRATNQAIEARFVADDVAERLHAGTPANDIAMIFRSVRNVRIYEDALLARNIPVQTIGDVNLYDDPRALDALALLWNVHDPFRHDWMLRTLTAPGLALSDATVAILCSEPPDGQTLLFETEEEAVAARAGRWDPKRALRLGWNVLRGTADAHIPDVARRRIVDFRALRAGWLEATTLLALPDLALSIWRGGLARIGPEDSARARGQALIVRRLLARIRAFAVEHPLAELGDFLEYAEARAQSELENCEELGDDDGVRIATVDAVRGRDFAHVVVPNARAGAFPRWYVPDAFFYSPSQGMIAKENVGEARTSRTAKFSYYVYRTKARERYNDEERRAFAYALTRARESATVTAWGRATRGATAPEFLEELRR